LAAHQAVNALLVDVDPIFLSELAPIVTASGLRVIPVSDFAAARHELYSHRPDFLVANVRLGAFNGIHLAYLAKNNNPLTRVVIYGQEDHLVAGEVQSAGAFYERREFVRYSLAAFLQAPALPARDRRGVSVRDRREIFRGGRRTTDLMAPPSVAM
jgi:hypothetical protein